MDVKLRILGISALSCQVSAFILLFPEDTSPPLPDPSSVMDYGVEIIASNLKCLVPWALQNLMAIFVHPSMKSGSIIDGILEIKNLMQIPIELQMMPVFLIATSMY